MKVYFAHCVQQYGTPQEERDIEILELLGFTVINPNGKEHQAAYQRYKDEGLNPMDYFMTLVEECDCLAFRALPDGRIPAGVHKEIRKALESGFNKPVFELPNALISRGMSVEDTREYLRDIGDR